VGITTMPLYYFGIFDRLLNKGEIIVTSEYSPFQLKQSFVKSVLRLFPQEDISMQKEICSDFSKLFPGIITDLLKDNQLHELSKIAQKDIIDIELILEKERKRKISRGILKK
jgi:hypothetical protein